MGYLGGVAAGYPKVARGPVVLVAAGFALGSAGLATLSVATFQTQLTVPATSLGGPTTLTFTVLPVPAVWAAFLAVVLVIPLILAFFPERFNLMALVFPCFVALSTAGVIVDTQLIAGLVVSSATWVFFGDALVLAGCLAEGMGVVTERERRTRLVASQTSRGRPSRPAVRPRS